MLCVWLWPQPMCIFDNGPTRFHCNSGCENTCVNPHGKFIHHLLLHGSAYFTRVRVSVSTLLSIWYKSEPQKWKNWKIPGSHLRVEKLQNMTAIPDEMGAFGKPARKLKEHLGVNLNWNQDYRPLENCHLLFCEESSKSSLV